jgi:uracil-DNA glycosylase
MTSAADARLAAHSCALAACRACGLAEGIVPITSSARRPSVMLVGQAPGQVEAAGGRPFAGRAGRTLFRWIERAGMDETTFRERVYIAAVTRCYPGPSASGRGDRVPSREEQERCAEWLNEELRIIRPAVVIPVGRLAIARFLPNRPLDELIGCEHAVEHAAGNSVAIPLPHPSGASSWIHQGNHRELLERALRLIGRELVRANVRGKVTRSVA